MPKRARLDVSPEEDKALSLVKDLVCSRNDATMQHVSHAGAILLADLLARELREDDLQTLMLQILPDEEDCLPRLAIELTRIVPQHVLDTYTDHPWHLRELLDETDARIAIFDALKDNSEILAVIAAAGDVSDRKLADRLSHLRTTNVQTAKVAAWVLAVLAHDEDAVRGALTAVSELEPQYPVRPMLAVIIENFWSNLLTQYPCEAHSTMFLKKMCQEVEEGRDFPDYARALLRSRTIIVHIGWLFIREIIQEADLSSELHFAIDEGLLESVPDDLWMQCMDAATNRLLHMFQGEDALDTPVKILSLVCQSTDLRSPRLMSCELLLQNTVYRTLLYGSRNAVDRLMHFIDRAMTVARFPSAFETLLMRASEGVDAYVLHHLMQLQERHRRVLVFTDQIDALRGGLGTRRTAAACALVGPSQPSAISAVCHCCLEWIGSNGYRTACGHAFHRQCVTRALQRDIRCPTCRQALLPAELTAVHDE